MPVADHPIFSRLGITIPGGHGEASAALNEELNSMLGAMDEYLTTLSVAENVSGDYREEVRAAKQAELVDRAKEKLLSEISKASQTLQATANNLQEEIHQVCAPKLEDDRFAQLLSFVRLESVKRDFERLDPAGKRQALMIAAKDGDRTLISICEGSLIPLIDGNLLDSAKEVFAETVAAGPMKNLQITEHYLHKLKSTSDAISRWAEREVGGRTGILPRPTGTSGADMSSKQKAEFISQYGLPAWEKFLYTGERPPMKTTEQVISEITGE